MTYFLSFILFLLPVYQIRFNLGFLPINLLDILIIIVFLWWLGRSIYMRNAKIPPGKILLPIVIFTVAAIIGILVSPEKRVALGQLKSWIVLPILFGLVLFDRLQRGDFKAKLNLLYTGLIAAGLLVGLHTIGQKISGQVALDGRVLGIYGLFPKENASPNFLALYLAPLAVLALGIAMPAAGWKKWFYFSGAIIMIGAIYFSGSRGGILAVLAGLLAIIFYLLQRKFTQSAKLVKIAAAIIVVLALFFLWQVAKPDFSAHSGRVASSNNTRWEIWQSSWQIIKSHPIFGIGLGNFQNYFIANFQDKPGYQLYIIDKAYSPHNLYLALYLNLGLLGLAAFLWLLYLFFQSRKEVFLWPAICAMVAILAYGLVDTPYFKNDLSVLFWALFFIAMAFDNSEKIINN